MADIKSVTEYYSQEMNMKYVSVSQIKSFCGTSYAPSCEAAALAELRGEIKHEPTTSMLVGSYVDAFFSGELDSFKAEHPEILLTRGDRKGELKSDFIQAERMIERAQKDPTFMAYCSGRTQEILTGEIGGVPFKARLDFVPEKNGKPVAIVDLKTVKSMSETFYIKDSGEHISWLERWNYDAQGAAYQALFEQNYGVKLPFYIAAISKDKDVYGEPHPRIKVIEVPQMKMDERLEELKRNAKRVQAIKNGEIEPIHCGRCSYCADTLPCEVISMDELLLDV